MDGLGESLIGLLSGGDIPIPFRLNGLHGNGSASEEIISGEGRSGRQKYANKRAERWFALRKRFERTYEHRTGIRQYPLTQLISIPNNSELKSQLSQPKIKEGNRLGVESKQMMKTRGIPSPDDADAVVYACDGYSDSENVVPEFDYTAVSDHCKVFKVDHKGKFEQYVSVYQEPSLVTSAIVVQWFPMYDSGSKPRLQVIGGVVVNSGEPKDVISQVEYIARSDVWPVKEWVANKEMFGDPKEWHRSPDRLYVKCGVRLKKNIESDDRGSLTYMNQLFSDGQIVIHTLECKDLIMQLSQWRRSKGSPNSGLGLANALCNLLTRLRAVKKMENPFGKMTHYHSDEEWEKMKREARKIAVVNRLM
jgi:hypothetical protein